MKRQHQEQTLKEERAAAIYVARQLCYSETIIAKIKEATTSIQIEHILIEGRHNLKEPNNVRNI